MGRRRKPSETSKPAAVSHSAPAGDRLRPLLLALLTALLVARPLYPSESAAVSGDGMPMVMLWIALVLFWLLGAIGEPVFRIRTGWADAAVAALVVWHTLAGVWAASHAAPRPAINMTWEWIAFGLSFFMLRQLVVRRSETRALVAVMIALGVALASYGLYQRFYEMPATEAQYKRNPDQALREAGLSLEAGSAERMVFEKRLESREPIASFALTNSLAGYLAPWLAVLVGIGLSALWRRRGAADTSRPAATWPLAAAVVLAALIMGMCLLLTKSRSAYAATAMGIVLALVVSRARALRIGWKLPAIAAGLVAGLIAAGWAAGGLDREVLSEAGKSLGYRVQYWRSTMAMIGDHPWLGVGPGQFQGHYTAYKLPEASEEIADPHNFLLDIWVTAGTPGLAILVVLLGLFVSACWRHGGQAASDDDWNRGTRDAAMLILGGGLAGFLLSIPVGLLSAAPPGPAVVVLGLPLAALTLAAFVPWVRTGRLPVLLPAVGVATLLVNLLAAGGIGFPGVAGTLWLLLAVGLTEVGAGRIREAKPAIALASLAGAVGLLLACYFTGYGPVMDSQTALRAAAREPGRAVEHLADAVKSDPWAAEPWRQLAATMFQVWSDERSPDALDAFRKAAGMATVRDPYSASTFFQVGEWYRGAYETSPDAALLSGAIQSYRRAVELYPTSASHRGRLALALDAAGDRAGFQAEAGEAFRLDRLTSHEDKKLRPELRQELLQHGANPE